MNKHNISAEFPNGKLVFFVTSNIHKFQEARLVLAEFNVAAAMLKIETTEIQDDDLETIARTTAIDAVKTCSLPIIVEDAGLLVTALGDFPGPYSSYVYRTIGSTGILRLMQDRGNRDARFRSVVVFTNPETPPKCFRGEIEGEVSTAERGSSGFGFDPIFQPSHSHRTFAEMTIEEKNKYSHRAQALRKFARWYTSNLQRRF